MSNKEEFHLSRELVEKVIKTVDAGLCLGKGRPIPGNMCVEAAVCYAMGLPHGDEPTCVDPVIRSLKIRLNDSSWSSNKARAEGMRRLAVLQLGTKGCFDGKGFAKKLALETIKVILPIALSAAGLHDHAAKCAAVTTLSEGQTAAYAAADAADDAYAAARAADDAYAAARAADAAYAAYAAHAAVRAAYAAYAAYAAARAARAAVRAAVSDKDAILRKFAAIAENILIEMDVPAVKYLDLLEEK